MRDNNAPNQHEMEPETAKELKSDTFITASFSSETQ